MELNVCLLNDSFPPVIDGVSNAVINYANIIQEFYGKSTVVTPNYPNTTDDYIFPVLRYPSINTTKVLRYRTGNPFNSRILHSLEKQQFDILHSHCPFASSLLARTLRERVNAPYVLTYHTKFDIEIATTIASESMQNIAMKLLTNNISVADEIWVVSEGAAQSLRNLGYQGETVLMENGVDFPKEKVSDERIQALRSELALQDDVPVFLFIGRLQWYKNIRITLDALSALKKLGRDFRFFVIGDGTDREEMQSYVDELGLQDHCRFFGSISDRERLRDFFSLADLFLFPSTYDTNGLVVREAAACQLASIIVEKSGAAEGIVDGQNGLLIEENATSMAQKLVWACDHLDTVHRIGVAAQNEIYISWKEAVEKAYHRYEYLYDKMERGLLLRKEAKGDSMFELVADWSAASAKLRSMPRSMIDKTNSIYEKFKK